MADKLNQITPKKSIKRSFWRETSPVIPELNLSQVQQDSYDEFLKHGIQEVLEEMSPIEDFTGNNWSLAFGKHSLGKEMYSPEESLEKGVSYEAPMRVEAVLVNKQTGERTEQEVFLGDIPLMTERGTFIVNGIERCVVNQLVRSPGIFFSSDTEPGQTKPVLTAEIRPMRGSWLEFTIGKNDVITVKIDRRRKFPATTLLRVFGLSTNEQILEAFADVDNDPEHTFFASTLDKDATTNKDESVLEIFKKMRPGDPVVIDNANALMDAMFFNSRRYTLGKVGRYKVNKKLETNVGYDQLTVTAADVVATLKYLIKLTRNEGEVDDIDHLANRRVRRVGELVQQNAFRVGTLRLERMIRERMSLTATDQPITPVSLVNARPIIAAINEFFRSSQLSAILDQTNPLSEIDNLRRLTVMGSGGITRERASFSIRDINTSQYGRVCPIRSPEGPNIGLVTYLALYSKVNEFGFLEAPYQKVIKQADGRMLVEDKISYLTADDEEKAFISHAEIAIDKDGYITDERVPVRYKGRFFVTETTYVQYVDMVARQLVGTSASLIPFVSHDEANRALMGTHMQCQAVPLVKPESPFVGTGMEKTVAAAMGRVKYAEGPGVVKYADGNEVIVKYDDQKEEKRHTLQKFVRTAQSTCYSQKTCVVTGQRLEKGDLLIDGPSSDNGELSLGANLMIAYMAYEGLGYEDALVISDRLVKEDVLTSINIEEYEAAVVDTKLGTEEMTADIPNVGELELKHLDERGIVVVGSEVGPGDILVGKIAPKGESELTAEERLLRAIFGEKAREVRDTSLRMPHGDRGVVVEVKVLDKNKGDDLEPGTNQLVKVKVVQMRKITVGDKLAGRHGNKGIISKIVPQADMPYLPDGRPVDIIISSLSVLSRMNLGQLLEAQLGLAAEKLGYKVGIPVFEEVSEDKIAEELRKAGFPETGKIKLYDGRTGEQFEQDTVVGVSHILKLIHMVEDKTHARSTGPYSLVTQQPLGGKAQMGGQRLGEMEVWALEAYGAAHILQEMLTVKSDDVVGRVKTFEAIVKGTPIPEALVPESFKVLVKELQSLCIQVLMLGSNKKKKDAEEIARAEIDTSPDAELVARQAAEMMQVLDAESLVTNSSEDVGTAGMTITSADGAPQPAAEKSEDHDEDEEVAEEDEESVPLKSSKKKK
jgi:DNA-directed RNA polymerase subunit beta